MYSASTNETHFRSAPVKYLRIYPATPILSRDCCTFPRLRECRLSHNSLVYRLTYLSSASSWCVCVSLARLFPFSIPSVLSRLKQPGNYSPRIVTIQKTIVPPARGRRGGDDRIGAAEARLHFRHDRNSRVQRRSYTRRCSSPSRRCRVKMFSRP